MKDSVIAVVEVTLLVSALVAAAPRGKSRAPAVPAQYASFVSFAAPAPAVPAAAAPAAAAAPVASSAKPLPPAPAPKLAAASPKAAVRAPRQALDIGPSNQVWGVVDSVDPSGRLSVKDKHGHVHVLPVSPELPVTVGGENKPAGLKDLKPGDNVTVTAADGAVSQVHVRLLFASKH